MSTILRQAVILLFLLSGCAGLVYEVVWAKMFTLLLGSDAEAQALVLGIFLGGLALGYRLFGQLVDRSANTLRIYAWLELAIALWAMISLSFYDTCAELYTELAAQSDLNSASMILAKIAMVSFILLPLTVFMGGTLPALVKWATHQIHDIEKSLSFLYFINSLGAVFGTVIAGYYLISSFGLELSISLAALLNLLIGCFALGLKRIDSAMPANTNQTTPAEREKANTSEQSLPKPFILGAFIIGFTTLSFEVAWVRLLTLVIGGSTYSFSIMLAAFISGIALGAWALSRGLFSHIASIKRFVLCEFLLVSVILGTLPLYQYLPYFFYRLNSLFSHNESAFYVFEATKFAFVFCLMLIPTFLIGIALPLLTTAATQQLENLGEKLGTIFAANTLGNLCGAIIGGLFLLPLLGIKGLLETMTLLNLCVAIWFLHMFIKWGKGQKITCLCIFLFTPLLYFSTSSQWNDVLLSAGSYRLQNQEAMSYDNFLRNMTQGKKLLFYENDRIGSVSVIDYDYPNGNISLAVNGKPEASASKNPERSLDMANQLLAGHIPLFLHPHAKSVLNIGLGSGITDGAILTHPIKKLDALEISPAVAKAAALFSEYNGHALEDKRVQVFVRDAKSFIAFSPSKYDIIISEPSNPWVAGVASLFTLEFYQHAINKLNAQGLFAQHLHGYEMNENTLALILRTFLSVFPKAVLFSTQVNDYLLIGCKDECTMDFDDVEKRFALPEVNKSLSGIKINRIATLLSTQIADNNILREIAGIGDINEDRYPVLEYQAPKAYFMKSTIQSLMEKDLRLKDIKESHSFIGQYIEKENGVLETLDFANLVEFHSRWSTKKFTEHLILAWQEQFPHDPDALTHAWSTHLKANNLSGLQSTWSQGHAHLPEPEKANLTLTKLALDTFKERHSPWLNLDAHAPITDALGSSDKNPILNLNIRLALYEYWKKFPEYKSAQTHLDVATKYLKQIETGNQTHSPQMQTFIEKMSQKLSAAHSQNTP